MSDSDTTTFERDVSREELVARARAMIPKLRAHQERTEADRRVSDEIFQELLDAFVAFDVAEEQVDKAAI